VLSYVVRRLLYSVVVLVAASFLVFTFVSVSGDPLAQLNIIPNVSEQSRQNVIDRKHLDDRQLDAILERLDRLCDEVHALNKRLDSHEQLLRIAHELASLNESMQALAYAALGQQGPQVRRRRSA